MIPTYQRRDLVLGTIELLDRVEATVPFDVTVVADGSTDGTAAAVREFAKTATIDISVVEQSNQGSAAARNRGAAESAGEVVLFIDDDMRAEPGLVAGHVAAYRRGADAVVGRMTLDPASPKTILAHYVSEWCDELAERLGGSETVDEGHDIFTGQVSLLRTVFESLGGFDEGFTEGGRYGNEDFDFGDRLIASGARVLYAADAVTAQLYDVTGRRRLEQWRDLGATDEQLLATGRDGLDDVRNRQQRLTIGHPVASAVIALAPRACDAAMTLPTWLACRLVDDENTHVRTHKLYRRVLGYSYSRGRTPEMSSSEAAEQLRKSARRTVPRPISWRLDAVRAAVRTGEDFDVDRATVLARLARNDRVASADGSGLIVIIGSMRSGSTLLCGLTEQLEGVDSVYEAMNSYYLPGAAKLENAEEIATYLAIFSAGTSGSAMSVKIFHEHLAALDISWSELRAAMPEATWLHLYRRDILAQYVSLRAAQTEAGAKWIVKAGEEVKQRPPVTVDWDAFVAFRDGIVDDDKQAASALADHSNYTAISYEYMAEDPLGALAEVVAPAVGRAIAPDPKVPYARTGGDEVSDGIANWSEIAGRATDAERMHPGLGQTDP